MADLPHPWGIYAQYQASLARRSSVDDISWGLEDGLDALCDNVVKAGVPIRNTTDLALDTAGLARVVASSARRERYRAALLRRQAVEQGGGGHWLTRPATDGRALVEARSELRHLQRQMRPADFALLVQSARGVGADELAGKVGVSGAAVRARLSRSRRLAEDLARYANVATQG